MGVGYFLRLGDKTSCGGHIISGCDNHLITGLATARTGDKYICGVDKQPYYITGGIPSYMIMGVHAAGTAHIRGTCSCKCHFIPSDYTASYGYEHDPSQLKSAPVVPLPTPKEEPRSPVDAGFCVLSYEATPASYEPWFFTNPEADVLSLYHELNPSKTKKPGSILIIADPLKKDPIQIEHLTNARDKVDAALEPLTNAEALFLYTHRNVIDQFSSIGGDYGGLLSGMAKEYFAEIEKTLISIQETYQNQFTTHFSGGVLLPIAASGLIRIGTTAACAVVLGAATAPTAGSGALACSVVVSGLSGVAVGKIGESLGSNAGEAFYNYSN